METPYWALTIAYWLHMLATVIWIGGLAAVTILVLPAARKTLDQDKFASFLNTLQHRLDPLAWFSLGILVATGLVQMSANPNYEGFLTVGNLWSGAILLKHLFFLGMVALSAYITWGIIPRLERYALIQASQRIGSGSEVTDFKSIQAELANIRRQEILLTRVNLILGVVVLALTALARAA